LSFRTALAVLASLSLTLSVAAQAPATPMAAPSVAQARQQADAALGDALQQVSVTVDRLNRALASITVQKWKAPGDVRQTTAADVDSMQRDLSGTLPSLVSAAQANLSRMSPAFAVYRNVDALYDVLLRVSETAQLAGSNDARILEQQRSDLESARTQLGAALVQATQAQDNEVIQLHTAAATAAQAAPPSTKTVVDDGPPAKPKSTRRTRKTTPPPAPAPQ
jgi:electron transfer flavoprotein alpha subunit